MPTDLLTALGTTGSLADFKYSIAQQNAIGTFAASQSGRGSEDDLAGDHRGADAANNTWVEELLAIGLNEMKSKGGNAALAKRDRQSGVRACVKRKTLSNKIPSIIFYTQSKLLAWREGRNRLW